MCILKIVTKIKHAEHRSQEGWWGGSLLGQLVFSIFEKPGFYNYLFIGIFFWGGKRKYQNTSKKAMHFIDLLTGREHASLFIVYFLVIYTCNQVSHC